MKPITKVMTREVNLNAESLQEVIQSYIDSALDIDLINLDVIHLGYMDILLIFKYCDR